MLCTQQILPQISLHFPQRLYRQSAVFCTLLLLCFISIAVWRLLAVKSTCSGLGFIQVHHADHHHASL